MKPLRLPITLATVYLLVYTIAAYAGVPVWVVFLLFAFSPVVVIWLVIRILKKGTYNGPDLKEEWGYEDYKPE